MDRIFIIKAGGNVIDNEESLSSFLDDFSRIEQKKILVHGGGKIATQIGEKLGIESKYINGRRLTDAATMDLVTMVYGGLINKRIVAQLQSMDCNAIGLTGADANTIPARKRPVKEVDYGLVGDLQYTLIGTEYILGFLNQGLVPVFAPLTHDGKGQLLNTNADTIAAALAVALSDNFDVRLIYCFEKKGVLRDVNNDDDVVHFIDRDIYTRLLEDKALADGILPKLDNAFDAIDHGVKEVLIGHAVDLLPNTGDQVSGTLISR